MTHKIQFNPSTLGCITVFAAHYALKRETGPREQQQYELLLGIINALHVDYLATSEAELNRVLRAALQMNEDFDASLTEIGDMMLDYLDEYAIEDDQ